MAVRARPILTLLLTVSALVGGAWLRWTLVPRKLNLWALDGLSYLEPQGRALVAGDLGGALLSWHGLHPPLTGALHGLIMALGGSLAAHWVATTSASLGAALLAAHLVARRAGPGAGALTLFALAVAPLQVTYGLHVSAYPWALLTTLAAVAALDQALDAESPRRLALAGGLAALVLLSHVLGLAVVGSLGLVLLVVLRARRAALRPWLLPVVLVAAWVVAQALLLARDPWTWHIGEREMGSLAQVGLHLDRRFGDPWSKALPLALAAVGVVAAAARGPRRTLALLVLPAAAWIVALAIFMRLGVADPRMTHYLIVPHALLVAAGALGLGALRRRRGLAAGLVALALLPWAAGSVSWAVEQQRLATEASGDGAPLRGLVAGMEPQDALIYLWEPRFLDDEPEYFDPLLGSWSPAWLGRTCLDVDAPRLFCSAPGPGRIWAAPTAMTDELARHEEELRLAINDTAGRVHVVFVPGVDAPPRPWPVERWLRDLGATDELTGEGWFVLALPEGLRVEER